MHSTLHPAQVLSFCSLQPSLDFPVMVPQGKASMSTLLDTHNCEIDLVIQVPRIVIIVTYTHKSMLHKCKVFLVIVQALPNR